MREEAKKAGSKGGAGILSGRMLFKYDPNLFQDDEAAADVDTYEERNEDEEEEKKVEEGEDASDNLRDGDGGNDDQEESKEQEVAKVDAALFY